MYLFLFYIFGNNRFLYNRLFFSQTIYTTIQNFGVCKIFKIFLKEVSGSPWLDLFDQRYSEQQYFEILLELLELPSILMYFKI